MRINEPRAGLCGYVAFYNGKQCEVYATSLFQAKELAVAYFKPPKSKRNMVHAHLAESADRQPVTHTPID